MKVIPFAKLLDVHMKERGDYPDGYAAGPRGCVVHFTCGHYEKGLDNAISSIKGGIKDGYTFLCISRTGDLVQAHDVNKFGRHAGESAWHLVAKKLKIYGAVSDDLIGIEMNNAGKLVRLNISGVAKLFPEWAIDKKDGHVNLSQEIPINQVRYVTEDMYDCPTGYYHKYSHAQEEMLIKTILWLYINCPSFKLEYVLGHHEVAGVLGIGRWRKNDPGGSLSMPMDSFRKYLIENKDALIMKHSIVKARA